MKRSSLLLAALAIGAGVIQTPALAQTPVEGRPTSLRGLDDVRPGTRLRIVTLANPPERIEGRFVGVHDATLGVQVGGAPRDLSFSQLLRVDEAYRDRRRGTLVGLIPGVVGVYVWDFFGPHPRYADQHQRYRENVIALAASTGVGALIGAAIGWPRWRPLQTSAR